MMRISERIKRDDWGLVHLDDWNISLWDRISTGGGFKNHTQEDIKDRGFKMDEWLVNYSKRKQKTNARI